MKLTLKTTLVAAFASFAALQGKAQDAGDDVFELSLNEMVNLEITTASKKAEKIQDAPATVYVITKEEIRQRGYIYLKDALRDLPGMETIENYFSESGTLAPVRGVVGNNKMIVLLNGMRVNPPGGEQVMLRSDFNILQAKQIEVIYGPGSTLYGQDAINMVINVITEDAADSPLVDVTLRGGSFNNKEAILSLSKNITLESGKQVGISSFLSYKDAGLSDWSQTFPQWWENNYRPFIDAAGLATAPVRHDKGTNAFLRVEDENSSLQIWHRESSRSSSEGGYTPILQFIDEAIWHDRSTIVQMENETDLGSKVSLESSLSFNRYEADPESRYVFPASASTVFYDDYKYALGTGLRLEEKFNIHVNDNVQLTAGLLAAYNDIISKTTFPGGVDVSRDITSQAGAMRYYTVANDPSSAVDVARGNNSIYSSYAAYLEGKYSIGEKFKAVTGIRIDTDTRYEQTPLSPRLALIYSLTPHLSAKYVFNKAFVAPAPYYIYTVWNTSTGIGITNTSLEPETATSNELNLSYSKGGLFMSTSLYHNTQANLIMDGELLRPANIIAETVYLDLEGTQPRILAQSANGGETIANGVDIFTKYSVGKASLWGSVSYVHFQQSVNDEMVTGLNGISAMNLRLGMTYNVLKNLSATAGLILKSTPDNIANTTGLDEEIKTPYEVNLNIIYTPVPALDVFANFRNLTNHRYALQGLATPIPQEPITINGGVRFKLNQ